MILIEPIISGADLLVKVPTDPPEEYVIPLFPTESDLEDLELLDITLWGDELNAYAVSSELDQALSAFLGHPVRLVLKGPAIRPLGADEPNGPLDYSQDVAGSNFQGAYLDHIAVSWKLTYSVRHVSIPHRLTSKISHLKQKLLTSPPSPSSVGEPTSFSMA